MRRAARALLVITVLAVSWESVRAQAGCACTTSFVSGPNNYTAASAAYNRSPGGSCSCNNQAFTGVCQNLQSSSRSQSTNSNGTVTYTAEGTCLQAPSTNPPTGAPSMSATPPASPPSGQAAATPPSSQQSLQAANSANTTTPPPTNAPPPFVPPPTAVPPFLPPTVAPPQPATPPTTPPQPSPPAPGPSRPPSSAPPSPAPPSPAPPSVPPTPSTPGGIINNNSGNSNTTNINNTNITNISNSVTNVNNTVTNNIVNNINSNIGQATPGTTPASPPPSSPPAPPTPVTSVTSGASVPPVPIIPPPPAPPSPPQCGVQPQCRIFTENKLCCQDEGIVSQAQYSSTWILCTHAVQLPQTCLSVGGPANISVSPFFTEGTVGTNFNYALTWNTTSPYIGKVTIDIEAARTQRPECTLNISPCIFEGNTVNTVAPVTSLTFAAINPLSFELGYVGLPATNLETLDSFAWTDPTNSSACYEQSRINLVKGSFGYSTQAFVTQAGYKVPCNPQVTFDAILPNAQQLNSLPSSGVPGVAP